MASRIIRFPQGKAKALTLSYDDGVEQDIRLLEIMNKHGLKGTFNLNSGGFAPEGTVYEKGWVHRRMTEAQVKEVYTDCGQEIAIHGLTHPWLEKLTPENMIYEIFEDRKNLEEMFGCEVRGGAYPFGSYSDELVAALKMCGIVYCRTVKTTERFDIPKDWLRLPTTCHHTDDCLFPLTDKFVNGVPDINEDGWLFYVWGHSYEFEGDNNWDRMEKFAEEVGNKDDIWYATNIEIYDYINAFYSIRYSADGSYATNPTSTDVWMSTNRKVVCVPAGQRVKLY